jgi:L,D-peptidoglycan transpeptidase YkuD (ErfK/YbiS/YcfS/YnhG family)
MNMHQVQQIVTPYSAKIGQANIRQLVLVTCIKNHKAQLTTLQLADCTFTPEIIINNLDVVIGINGATTNKIEGDHKTPLGLYKFGTIFGKDIPNKILSNLPYQQVIATDKFIDDPTHQDYNKWIRGNTSAKSYENLLREDHIYDLAVIIEYNMQPIIANKGSAIFMHIWRNSDIGTQGCVAMSKGHLQNIINWLNIKFNPHILIVQA